MIKTPIEIQSSRPFTITHWTDYEPAGAKKEAKVTDEKPKDHSDGDYSYLCGNPHCRCAE